MLTIISKLQLSYGEGQFTFSLIIKVLLLNHELKACQMLLGPDMKRLD